MSDLSHDHCLKCAQPEYACECDDPEWIAAPVMASRVARALAAGATHREAARALGVTRGVVHGLAYRNRWQ